MLTFQQALDRVRSTLPEGQAAADTGYEDAQAFAVTVGPSLWITTGDDDFAPLDNRLTLVDRQTGDITEASFVDELDRVDEMAPVSV